MSANRRCERPKPRQRRSDRSRVAPFSGTSRLYCVRRNMEVRRSRHLWLVAFAILWFATSTHALARSTVMMVSNLGDANHPALVTASELDAKANWANSGNMIVIDTATFWASVDEYDCCNECKAFCASVSVAVIAQISLPNFDASPGAVPLRDTSEPLSFIPAIDTPPPRTL
jgi:hypothetical protein